MIKELKRRFGTSSYGKSLIVLTGGTFVSQLIPIIFYPIISRLFLPEQVGSAAVFSQMAAILAIIMGGGYMYAIFIAKSEREAVSLVFLTILLSAVILSVVWIIFWLFRELMADLFNEPLFESLFYIPLITAFFITIYQCYNEWCVRNKIYKQLSVNKLINSSSISLSETLCGITNPMILGNGKVFSEFIGRGLSAVSCVFSVLHRDRETFYKNFDIKDTIGCIYKYKKFPSYIMTGKLINSISCAIPIFLIGIVFSKEELGWFSMANAVITIPVSVITIAASDAFRQRANEDFTIKGSCRSILIKTIVPLTFISVSGFSVLYIIAPFLFKFLLGIRWEMAGYIVRYLVPMVCISFVSEVIRPVFIIAEKKEYDFIWQILFLASMTLLAIIAINMKDFKIFLVMFSGIKSILFLLQLFWCYRFSKSK